MEPLGRRRSNDSQVTLVDASSASYGSHRPYTFVSFSRDNMKNTTIFAEDGVRALYSVETDMRATRNAHTRVYRGIPVGSQDPSGALLERERELVAEVKRKELREDRIKFGGAGKSKKISKWLHGANGRWTDLWVVPLFFFLPFSFSLVVVVPCGISKDADWPRVVRWHVLYSPASFEWGNKLYTWRTNHSRQIAVS